MAFEDEYTDLDATALAALVRAGEVEAAELLEIAIARTEALNPRLNAIVDRMDDLAREQVATLPKEAPLAGVPFLVKDLGTSVAATPTTHGCRFFAGRLASYDSEVVRRYRAAGLLLFGKTASPEFGLTTSTESLLWGQTRNPWNLELSAGGSSGGAAAAVAARILPAAHASDGGGSIRIPASCCGLFGLKPTRFRVSYAPDAGERWAGLSVAHAVSRSVRDSAALLDAAAGPALGDLHWCPPPSRPFVDEVGAPPGSLRVGLITAAFNGVETDPQCLDATRVAARLCESLGHRVIELESIELPREELGQATRTIIYSDLVATLAERSRELGRDLTRDDVEPMTFAMVERSKDALAVDLVQARRTIERVARLVANTFLDVDLLLTPTMAAPPKQLGALAPDRTDGDGYVADLLDTIAFTQLWNVAGNPAASLPLHWSDEGLPIGVQLAASYGREDVLFRIASQIEEAAPWRDKRPAIS